MTDNRFAVPLEELVSASRVDREQQVEVQADVVVPPPVSELGGQFYGDGTTGDVDGD